MTMNGTIWIAIILIGVAMVLVSSEVSDLKKEMEEHKAWHTKQYHFTDGEDKEE